MSTPNTALQPAPALCFDCGEFLAADARYDICDACVKAEREAYSARQSCANSMPERQRCVCSQHGEVR